MDVILWFRLQLFYLQESERFQLNLAFWLGFLVLILISNIYIHPEVNDLLVNS